MADYLVTYDDKTQALVRFDLNTIFHMYLSHSLYQKPSFPVDPEQPFRH